MSVENGTLPEYVMGFQLISSKKIHPATDAPVHAIYRLILQLLLGWDLELQGRYLHDLCFRICSNIDYKQLTFPSLYANFLTAWNVSFWFFTSGIRHRRCRNFVMYIC